MKPLSQNLVTAEEDAQELTFVFQYQSGWIERVAVPLTLLGSGGLAWRFGAWWLSAAFAAGFLWMAVQWFRNPSAQSASRLQVNTRELLVIPDLIAFPNRAMRWKPDEVKFLGYLVGEEDQPSGLYLNDTCVFSGMDRSQAEAIAFRIFYKFPNIGCKDETPTSMLHGDDSGIVSLGLSSAVMPRNP